MDKTKLETANAVLSSFSISQIERRDGGWYVVWESRGATVSRRWAVRGGQDFYATWSHRWPGGGTAMTALSQLVRWLRGQPVLPIATWRYWSTDKIKLLPESAVGVLRDGGYPDVATCVLCGESIQRGFDWWSLDGVSGPCCSLRNGCKQKNRNDSDRR